MHRFLLLCACVALLAPTEVRAQVIGVDLGSEFIKVAAVRRSDGIDIVLNEQTRRKTPNFVGFRGKDRFIGEDAKSLVGRFPDRMVGLLNRLVGVPFSEKISEWFHSDVLCTNAIAPEDERATIALELEHHSEKKKFSAETLLAMVFDYVRSMTAHFTGQYAHKQDAVATVPHFYDMPQRRALAQAAALGNTNVIGAMHTTTAIALQYGLQNRGFGNETRHVLFYDMGATKTETGVYTFEPPASGAKRAESMGRLTARVIESDPFLGGRSFDACLARLIASKFAKSSGIDVLADTASLDARKGLAVLMRSANRAKEILSSNKECPVIVEGITRGRDFSCTVQRTEFEEQCAPLFARATSLAKETIAKSGLSASDLHAFEVHGGGVRIPKLIDDLASAYGRPVQRTLNGDESAVLGAAFHAARVSSTFGVKGFAITDALPYNITFAFSPKPSAAETSGEAQPVKQRALFENVAFPAKKAVSVNRTQDFSTTFFANGEPMQTLRITGVHAALDKIGHFAQERDPQNSFHIRIETNLDGCGVLGVSTVMLRYKEYKKKETGIKTPETEGEESVEVVEPELVKHDVPLSVEWEYAERPPLTTDAYEASLRLLKAQEAYEANKRAIAQARNDLESLLIAYEGEAMEALRAAVDMDAELEASLTSTLGEVKEWLYDGDGLSDDTPADSFRSRHQEITTAVDAIRYSKAALETLPPLDEDAEGEIDEAPADEGETDKSPEEL